MRSAQPDPAILEHLAPPVLLGAYVEGIFPMVQDGELYWFSPDPRGLLPLDERFHVSRSLARTIRRGACRCTVNRAFHEVLLACARRQTPEQVWISPEIEIAYTRLHELGWAHSVEAWPAEGKSDRPIGGLYGVAIGGAFFAESMFHTATDAGKVALVHCVERLRRRGFVLMDIQWTTDNLKRFGAYELPRKKYLSLLREAVTMDVRFD
ncbi:MAG: leucyl/phenylalanyl-tRNA--protein transferase [Phycisphaerae bacterium]